MTRHLKNATVLTIGRRIGLIPLSRGLYAIVDAEDIGLVSRYRWNAAPHHKTFYAGRWQLRQDGTQHTVRMHTELIGHHVDHQNGDGLDNRRSNLRKCTRSQNEANKRMRIGDPRGFKGVSQTSNRPTYAVCCAGLRFTGFTSPQDAARAYDRAAVARWGEFACVNFPEDFPEMNLRCARRAVA